MRIPNTIRTDDVELRQAWEKLARIINYELPAQLVTLPISESDVTNLVEDLAKKQDKTDSGGDSGGGGSSITLPINESDVRNLVNDLAKCEKSDNKDKPFGYPRLTGDGIVPDNELPKQTQTFLAVAHKWLNSFDRATGLFTATQPAASDLSDGVIGSGPVLLDTGALAKPWRKRYVLWESSASALMNLLAPLDIIALVDGGCQSGNTVPSATEAFATYIRVPNSNLGASRRVVGSDYFYTGNVCVFECLIRAYNGLGGYRAWIGFSNTALETFDTTATHGNFIGFYYNSAISTNWLCRVGTSAGMTTGDTGVAASLTVYHRLRVVIDGVDAKFYVNDVLVATISTTYPTGVVHCYIGYSGTNVGGSDYNGIALQYLYAEAPRA